MPEIKEEIQPQPLDLQDTVALARYTTKLDHARDSRQQARKEFDGMTFEQDYERNREANYSFLRPKRNDDDVRVNSGTAEKKIELMMNELLSMNFQPDVRAIDKNDIELKELSVEFTDIVRATNDQEQDDDVYQELYSDLLTQRIAVAYEEFYSKEYAGGYTKKCARKRRLSPLQLYVADIYLPTYRFQEQPYIVIYDKMLYDEAPKWMRKNKNWKHVIKPGGGTSEYAPYFKYRFSSLEEDKIEIVTYYSIVDNEYQVIVNGVMMFPPNTPMPTKNYPLIAVTVKPIPDFFYGKPPIASAKFLQSLNDESIVNTIRKWRQSIEPPLGVKGGKVYSRNIWNPGSITQGVTAGTFERLLDQTGVTQSDFAVLQFIQQKTEEFIGTVSIQNMPGQGQMTATQILELQKQAIKMLGFAVFAVMRLKRDATFLRLFSLFELYFKPEKKIVKGDMEMNKYRQFQVDNGKTRFGDVVQKYIVLTDRNLDKKEMSGVKKKEDELSRLEGKPVRYSFLNVKALELIPLDFKVVVTPEARDSGALDKVLFQDELAQLAQISQMTGEQINKEKVISRFETVWKSKDMFLKAPTPLAMETGEGSPEQLLQGLQQMEKSEMAGALTPDAGAVELATGKNQIAKV
jgi:hypothetical protein